MSPASGIGGALAPVRDSWYGVPCALAETGERVSIVFEYSASETQLEELDVLDGGHMPPKTYNEASSVLALEENEVPAERKLALNEASSSTICRPFQVPF